MIEIPGDRTELMASLICQMTYAELKEMAEWFANVMADGEEIPDEDRVAQMFNDWAEYHKPC